jgi:hypothetical protein
LKPKQCLGWTLKQANGLVAAEAMWFNLIKPLQLNDHFFISSPFFSIDKVLFILVKQINRPLLLLPFSALPFS